MTGRERLLAALSHCQPDRPPRDLGSTTATGIHPTAYTALKDHLGLGAGWSYLSARAQLARVELPVLDRFEIDCLPLIDPAAAEPPALDASGCYVDRWHVERRLPRNGGHYYVNRPPLAGAGATSDLLAFPWPEPRTEWAGLAAEAARLRAASDRALVLNLEVGFLHQAQFMRGFDLWLMDLAAQPELAASLMDAILDVWLTEAQATMQAVGPHADVVVYADDVAFQDRLMFSPQMYRALIKPRQQRVFDLLRASGSKVFYHSCGNVWPIISDLVEMGIDALNPVQVSAGPMADTATLKALWGGEIAFWGGIDTQAVLPRGSAGDVRREVWRRLDDLAAGGGYVLAAVHDVQPEVPAANLCALFDAATQWASARGETGE